MDVPGRVSRFQPLKKSQTSGRSSGKTTVATGHCHESGQDATNQRMKWGQAKNPKGETEGKSTNEDKVRVGEYHTNQEQEPSKG